MARIGIVFGLLLCLLAGVGLTGSTIKLPSLVFPMMLGIPILVCGVVSLNPHRRKLGMFSAAIIGVFGLVSGGGEAIYTALRRSRGDAINSFALEMMAATAFLCLLFVIAYVVYLWRGRAQKNGARQSL